MEWLGLFFFFWWGRGVKDVLIAIFYFLYLGSRDSGLRYPSFFVLFFFFLVEECHGSFDIEQNAILCVIYSYKSEQSEQQNC